MRRTRSLVITPFDASGARLLDALRRALEEIGVEVFRFDHVSAGASWANAITDAVRAADFVVVDVTRRNPNVSLWRPPARCFHESKGVSMELCHQEQGRSLV